MNELKPCPFCGGSATTTYFLGLKVPHCKDCWAVMLPDYFPITEADVKIWEKDAVEKWNRRVEE